MTPLTRRGIATLGVGPQRRYEPPPPASPRLVSDAPDDHATSA